MAPFRKDPVYVHPKPPPSQTRRSFLRKARAATAAVLAFPYVVPAAALGRDGHTAPSERIVMGCLGVGSQGLGNLKGFLPRKDAQFVAVCDVDSAHREEAQNVINGAYRNQDCAGYNDFRALLDHPGLDALSIALPDHWHAIPVLAAAEKKLDMYAEKPLANTIREGQAMIRAVEASGVVWQTGSWQRSVPRFHQACTLVRNGAIGDVHTIEVGLPTGKRCDPQPEMPIPVGFDYDMWLGPAPAEPYTEKRCHWDFRWIFDYSGGQLTDWAAHHCDIANWAMGTEETGPVRVSGSGRFPKDGLWNTAIHYRVEAEFPAGASPAAPNGFRMILSDSYPNGARFLGETGEIFVSRSEIITEPVGLAEMPLDTMPIQLYRSTNHATNFFDCVRSREATVTPIRPAHRAISIAHLGNIAMRLGREVEWDPAAEKFVGDPLASRMLSRPMRAPWRL